MDDRQYFVYILSNVGNSVLYIGITNDIFRRIEEHRSGSIESFTKKYRCHKLVYYEVLETAYDAITREKQLKAGSRKRKDALIASLNPTWRDLVDDLTQIASSNDYVLLAMTEQAIDQLFSLCEEGNPDEAIQVT